MQTIHVVAAVIFGHDGRILLAKRPQHVHKGGLWEFPGGKVELAESVAEALSRELREELAIDVLVAEPLIKLEHSYPDKAVLLDFWKVTSFSGDPRGNEGQPIEWVARDQLHNYNFPEANVPVLELLRGYR